MDLTKFKVLSDANDSYHVQSPTGRTFTVLKEKLKPEAHAMIKKMCAGGVAGYAKGGTVQHLDDGGGVGQNTVLAPAPAPGPDLSTANVIQPSVPQTVVDNAPPQIAPRDPLVQNKMDTGALLDKEEQAAQSYAGGADKANKMTQQAYQDEIDQLKGMQTPQDIANSYKAKDDQLMQDYMNNKIDPARYVHNLSTGSKVTAAIGMLLSGAGAGRNGTNLAVQQFNNAVNNDISAQQNDQSKSMNLYKMNRDSMKDDQQALIATQNQMLTGVQAKVAQAAAQSQNADSHFKASQLVNQIEQQKIQNRLRLGLLTQGSGGPGGTSGTDPLSLIPEMVPAEHQKDAITEVGQAKAAVQNEGSINKLFDQAAEDTRPGTGWSKTSVMNAIPGYTPESKKALELQFDPLVRDIEGRYNVDEQQHIKENMPQFGDSDETINTKRQALQDFVNHKKAGNTFKTFTGVPLSNFSATSDNPVSRLNPQQQRMYQIAKANPDTPAAQAFFKKFGVQ